MNLAWDRTWGNTESAPLRVVLLEAERNLQTERWNSVTWVVFSFFTCLEVLSFCLVLLCSLKCRWEPVAMLGTSVFLKFEVQFTNAAIEVTTVRNRSEWILKARRKTHKTKREMQKTKRDSFFVFCPGWNWSTRRTWWKMELTHGCCEWIQRLGERWQWVKCEVNLCKS